MARRSASRARLLASTGADVDESGRKASRGCPDAEELGGGSGTNTIVISHSRLAHRQGGRVAADPVEDPVVGHPGRAMTAKLSTNAKQPVTVVVEGSRADDPVA